MLDTMTIYSEGVNCMDDALEIVWKEFKSHCIRTISEKDDAIETYLETCLPVSLNDGVLVLDVPTIFGKEQIKSRFLDTMKELFIETGFGTDIVIRVTDIAKSGRDTEKRSKDTAFPTLRVTISKNGLNPNYLFSSFVVGKSNRLPHAASLAVAESPGTAYNPLFIWGGVGLGKTHLMHAIGNHIEHSRPDANILYASAEKFTNDLISSIKNNTNNEFRDKYRSLDVLLIDDIQFISDKVGTQEEFFHTFNALHNAKKQVVISSDRPPKEIQGVEDRLVSRFEWGLVTDIQKPDLETRVAILQKKIEMKGYKIPQEIAIFIAENIPSNIRELEGALNRISAFSELNGEPITLENVSLWLKDLIKENRPGPVSIDVIQNAVAESFGFSIEDLLSQNRTADLALARQVAMYLARSKTGESLQQISRSFNKKDHTTVIHACKKVEDLIATDYRLRSIVDNISAKL